MRILVTGFTSNRGGIETFVINYVKSINKIQKDIQFDVLGYEKHPAFEQEIRDFGGEVFTIPSPRHPDSRKELDRFFRENAGKYDVLWCNKCDLANIDYLIYAKKYHIPKRIIHSHSSSNMYSGLRKWGVSVLHRMHRNKTFLCATDLWSCSDFAAKWMFGTKAVQKKNIQYIPNAISVSQFTYNEQVRMAYRNEMKLDGKTVYGCVGRLSQVKNPSFSIEIFGEIWKKDPNSVLLMVGEGELKEALQKQAAAMPCVENIRFLGMRNDVRQLLQAMDCYLMPSLFEGFPVAAVEAQAAGLPVFVSSDGITRQVALTPLCHFLPLSMGSERWAEEILGTDLSRQDFSDVICNEGFDIQTAASRLWDLLSQTK